MDMFGDHFGSEHCSRTGRRPLPVRALAGENDPEAKLQDHRSRFCGSVQGRRSAPKLEDVKMAGRRAPTDVIESAAFVNR